MRSGNVLPSSVDALTPEWLTEALRASGTLESGRVTSVASAPLSGGVALMSNMLRLHITYESKSSDGPESLIAKFPPTDAAVHSRGLELGFFEGESGFYSQLANSTATTTPRCYFAQFDASTGRFLILLEDLSAARLGDVTFGCTDSEAASGIETLAHLHASWWESDSLDDYGWLRRFEDRQEIIVGLLPEAFPTFTSRFRDKLESDQFELLRELSLRANGLPAVRFSGPRTLLHGDFKLDNLFFRPSGEMVVCDWGLVMAGPAMFDVASFLSLNLAMELRRHVDLDLIRRYVATLEAEGVRDYGFHAALADYRLQLVAFLPRLIGAGGLAEFADEHALEEYALGLRRVISAVNDSGGIDDLLQT